MQMYRAFRASLAAMLASCVMAGGAAAQYSDDVIRIGVMNDQAGPYADNCGAGSVAAVRLAVEDIGGTVNGKKIEIVIADDQNKPDIGVSTALKWVDKDGVDAIVGCSASPIALAVQDIMRDKKKPYLIAGTASSETTNSKCTPMATNWAYDTYTLSKGSVAAQMSQKLDTWYFITVDNAFGKAWQADATRFITAAGGKVLGSILHPFNNNDFSSHLLQAQASGAKAIGIANAGSDLANLIKQAKEFGIGAKGQKLAPLGLTINSVHAIGLDATEGLVMSTSAYWDANDASRAFTKRYSAAMGGKIPNEAQIVTYSAAVHYLKAVKAANSDEGDAVMAQMRKLPADTMGAAAVSIRDDGVVMRDMLLTRVKAKAQSKGPWDYYEVLGTIPAADAWRPLAESTCPLVKK